MAFLRYAAVAAPLALAGALLSTPAWSQFAKPEDAIKYRQSAMFLMSNHLGRLAAMARGDRPFDAAAAQTSARTIDTLSRVVWDGFVPGTTTQRARADIWSNAADFRAAQERMVGDASKLSAAAGSLETLRPAVGALGASCKACHDKFRVD